MGFRIAADETVPFAGATICFDERAPNPPTRAKFWLGDHPRPCTCIGGPCDGGENGCGYEPAEWDAWEQGYGVPAFFAALFALHEAPSLDDPYPWETDR